MQLASIFLPACMFYLHFYLPSQKYTNNLVGVKSFF
jgi:hypothetical protein